MTRRQATVMIDLLFVIAAQLLANDTPAGTTRGLLALIAATFFVLAGLSGLIECVARLAEKEEKHGQAA